MLNCLIPMICFPRVTQRELVKLMVAKGASSLPAINETSARQIPYLETKVEDFNLDTAKLPFDTYAPVKLCQ
ncbi:hypothetical protein EJB05_17088 [Eragrostis curvula]|uniref:Uncharacterized protein n=1 Tax=Eragrostis curvula TaxID=38414 RepID=A0A5J9VJI4_9POAL|nr:hypothetical protein EJB05_17088 [Eragrostis curvula]